MASDQLPDGFFAVPPLTAEQEAQYAHAARSELLNVLAMVEAGGDNKRVLKRGHGITVFHEGTSETVRVRPRASRASTPPTAAAAAAGCLPWSGRRAWSAFAP
jgi:hypothetical protein